MRIHRCLFLCLAAVGTLLLLGNLPQPARAYHQFELSFADLMNEATHIVEMKVEKVDRDANVIHYRKVRDLKGKHPTEVIKHKIGKAGFRPEEWQTIMKWADEGKTAVFFHNGFGSETCIDHYWYQAYPDPKDKAKEAWEMSHGEAYMNMTYFGKAKPLAELVSDFMAGKQVVVPCLAGAWGDDLRFRRGPISLLRSDAKRRGYNVIRDFVAFAGNAALADTAGATSWTTYRGNAQRTASDGKPGPGKPNILWSMPAKEHYVASPVPVEDRLFVSGLGAFNVASFQCLSVQPKAEKRLLWSKSTPGLKLPTVSAPAVVDGRVIFGDGMHQTDGATLHCLALDKGLRLWQYRTPPPDRLVHLEGSPTVAGNRAYIGGGNLGVICVDIDKISLEGKVLAPKEIQKILDEKWAVLQKKYEDEKKKDPDFAIPPTEDDLPKATPAMVWQRGQKKWHVDAPVNLVGDRVLVCSAFLDKEMEGDKAIYCLDAKTGDEKWRTPLRLNPWGGASVSEKTVVVTGSTIGYYPNQLKGAKGDITALDLDSGKQLWQKEMPGGAVSCAVLADGMAICTATDGKVRAFDLANGDRKWIYDSKIPYFAPPAFSDGVVYAGDLNGVIHAIDARTGTAKWTLDLGAAPISSPGMVYGGPIVHGGRVYVNTCNLEGVHANKPTVVVCIGEK